MFGRCSHRITQTTQYEVMEQIVKCRRDDDDDDDDDFDDDEDDELEAIRDAVLVNSNGKW